MNPVEIKFTVDHLLQFVLYVVAGGIAAGGLVTLLCLYSDNLRRAKPADSQKSASASKPLTD
jgi:hypothetical protein